MGRFDTSNGSGPQLLTDSGPMVPWCLYWQAAVDAALGPELFGKMLLLPAEFFTFEFVYKNHSRHWRKEGGELTGGWFRAL